MNDKLIDKLVQRAKEAKEFAYAPYSNFKVGSALLFRDKIYMGCNIENASFTPTVCAERTAIFKVISEHNDFSSDDFGAIAVFTDDTHPSSPCGVCLQVMSEFVRDDFPVYLANGDGYEVYSFLDLLGRPFRPGVAIGEKKNT